MQLKALAELQQQVVTVSGMESSSVKAIAL